MARTITLSKLHVGSAVVIMADILPGLFLTAVRGIVPRKTDFVSTVLAVDQSAETCHITAAVTLAL